MNAGPWLVPVLALRRATGARRHEHRAGTLGELRIADTVVAADRDVDVDVDLTSIDGGVEVGGVVAASWQAACRRCLRPVGGRVEAEVRELYRPHVEGSGDDDDETYELGVDHIDLAPLARDAVLLALPLAPLCSVSCPGLCPTCGADLADAPCDCASAATDPRWGMLDTLRVPGGADDGPLA